MSENSVPSDQWKHEGYCTACRRRNYCKSECRAHRDNVMARVHDMFLRKTGAGLIKEALRAAKGE